MSFTSRLALTLAAAIGAAVLLAPIAGMLVAVAGFHIPFPRIFDRVVMVTVFVALLWNSRGLRFIPLLSAGFANPAGNLGRALRGFVAALVVIAILGALALAMGGWASASLAAAASRFPKYLLSAIAIAIMEEAFFRAFLLGGLKRDFGRMGALILSAAVYSIAHLVRSPSAFYVNGFEPGAGLITLAHSVDQMRHPTTAIPVMLGLFLLGIVLGEAFLQTGNVYLSAGLHCGFVLGSKLWPKLIAGRNAIPLWLAGVGPVPLIGGAAAWAMAIVLFFLLRPLGADRRT
ncbi:MAG TPA: CPBP family intramembrane glutamic endopeptidase [Candidatus Binataceae bacterium]|nr:CPBP family intramembrane glutamic endopeptidase [Candidatus Binataceae bacterium]